ATAIPAKKSRRIPWLERIKSFTVLFSAAILATWKTGAAYDAPERPRQHAGRYRRQNDRLLYARTFGPFFLHTKHRIRSRTVPGVRTCALPIPRLRGRWGEAREGVSPAESATADIPT